MKTILYCNTPFVMVFDNRNLIIRQIKYHRHPDLLTETDERITRQTFNLSGSLIQSLSPRQYDLQQANSAVPPNQKIFSSLSGQILRTDSTDEGTQSALSDIAGRSLISINAMNIKRIWQYESSALPGRPLTVSEIAEGEIARIVERFIWAGNSAAEKAKNLAGLSHAYYHCSGVDFIDSIALTGGVLSERRRFLKDDQEADWQNINNADSALAEAVFSTSAIGDATGAMLTQTDTQGNRQRQAYNVAGQLNVSGLTLNGHTTEQVIVRQRSYTAAGQIIQEIAGNGVVTSYSYEPETQRLIGIKTERPVGHASGAAVLQDLRYAFDPVGNVISVRNDAEATRFWRNQKIVPERTYIYDSLYQLVSATGREMADAATQRTTLPIVAALSNDKTTYTNYIRTYRYDRDDNLVRIQHSAPATGNNYSTELTVSSRSNRAVLKTLVENANNVDALFDPAGNQLQLLPGQTLSWSQRGDLRQVTPVMRDSISTSDREWYRYDAGGKRVIKATYQMQGNSQRQIRKLYLTGLESVTVSLNDAQTEVYDRIIAGNAEVLHWQLGKPSTLVNDNIRFSHGDRTGNGVLETDKAGLVISQEEFYPFGATAIWLARTQIEADYKTYRYSNKERDATGLYYYGFRYYQPWVGRWLSADPAGTIDGLNQYRMVRNNPILLRDNNGLAPNLPEYFFSDKAPEIGANKDNRTDWDVKNDISQGIYKNEEIRILFESEGGLSGTLLNASPQFSAEVKQSGWQQKEAVVKNELRVISNFNKFIPEPNTVLYRGISLSETEFEHIQNTGYIQNTGLSFFSSNRDVAKYFARHQFGKDEQGRDKRKVIFELNINSNKTAEENQLFTGKVAVDAYKNIIDDSQSRFNRDSLNGLKEIVALPGNIFKLVPNKTPTKQGLLGTVRKKLAKSDITTVHLELSGYQPQSLQRPHSRYL